MPPIRRLPNSTYVLATVWGVPVHRPTINHITRAAVVATLTLLFVLMIAQYAKLPVTGIGANAIFLGAFWGMVADSAGLGIERGIKPLLLNLVGATMLMGIIYVVAEIL